MPTLRRAFVCDESSPALSIRKNPRTGAVSGRWRLTWAGVRNYVVGGEVQRHLHRPEQVASEGFRRTLAALPAVPAHPPGGRSVVVGGGGAGTVAAEDVVWGAVSPVVELAPVPEWSSVLVPTAEVTFYDAAAIERLMSGVRESSLGYDAWIVRAEPGAVWVAPDGSVHPYDYEHILDPDDPRIVAADAAGLVDTELIGGNHFAAPIAAGRGGAQSALIGDAADAASSARGGGRIFFADDLASSTLPADLAAGVDVDGGPLPAAASPGRDGEVALVAALFAASAAVPAADPAVAASAFAGPLEPLGPAPVETGWESGWRTPVGVLLLAGSGEGILWTGTELLWVPSSPGMAPAATPLGAAPEATPETEPAGLVLQPDLPPPGAGACAPAGAAAAAPAPGVTLTMDPSREPGQASLPPPSPAEAEAEASISVTISVSIGEAEAEAEAEEAAETEEEEEEVGARSPTSAGSGSAPAAPSSLFTQTDHGAARSRYTGPMSKVKIPIPRPFLAQGSASGKLADATISIEIPDDPALQAALAAAFQAGVDQIMALQGQLGEAQAAASTAESANTELQAQVGELQGQVGELQADAEAGRAAILREVKALADACGISIPESSSPLRARLAFVRARCPSALAHVQGIGDDATDAQLRAASPAILAAYGVASVLVAPGQARGAADAGAGRGVTDSGADRAGARQTRPLAGQAAPVPPPQPGSGAPRSPAAAAARSISK